MLLRHHISINTINLIGIGALLLLAFLFTALVIFEEYRDFETDVEKLKSRYLQEKKETIKRETEKVVRFIKYEYGNYKEKLSQEELQRHIISAVNQLYTDLPANRYIFIYRFDGTNVLDPNRPEIRGKNMMGVKDPAGVAILPKLIEKAKNGGGFFSYIWEEPATGVFSRKISYVNSFKPWQWLIGTGVYTTELDHMVRQKKEALKDRLIKYVTEILTLSAILFGFAFAGIKLINKIIRDEIETFSDFFKEAATKYVVINKSKIRIKEFVPLVDYVNRMVDTIHQRKRELSRLNLSLEEKVRLKTAKLQKEKEFSDTLVKAQDTFIKTSIHEINTPLAVIMAQIDLLKMRNMSNKYVAKIEAAAKMIHTIYGDLSYLLRHQRVVYEKESLNLSRFLKERVDFFTEIASANKLSFDLMIEEDIFVFINREELVRLIDNNISNAIKYALAQSSIKISLASNNGSAILTFTNDAKEIENIEKIFEPFYQESKKENGFGLGLYLVRRICEKNGITVNLKSEKNVVSFSYSIIKGDRDEDTAS